jgi:hypothetical protein
MCDQQLETDDAGDHVLGQRFGTAQFGDLLRNCQVNSAIGKQLGVNSLPDAP